MGLYHNFEFLASCGAIACTLSLTPSVFAQITPDGSLGVERSIITPKVPHQGSLMDRIDGGAIRGSSLFHSFQDFNVGNLQQVYFANPAGIENILSRVTGTQASQIFGTLGVLGNANLFFINPNGINFGNNARLDIRGSFFASTASSLLLENGDQFSTQNPQAPPLLKISIRPGLQMGTPPQGEINNTGHLSVGQNLTLVGHTLNLEGQLQSGQNMTLNATQTLKIRDSVTNPFIASAGGQLIAQANKIDIFALNHPTSGFFSGGDMVFRSNNSIGVNAQFSSGGNFRIERIDGNPGALSSTDDPVIRSSGDVSFDSYVGPSLHIFAGGSVTADSIEITGPDTTNFINEIVTLSNGTTVAVNGSAVPTLDIRAGTTAFNPPGTTGDTTGFPTLPTTTGTGTSANITINSITNPGGLVFLTNQYQPNPSLSGDITVNNYLGTANDLRGGDVFIDSRGRIVTPEDLDTSGGDDVGGNITLLADSDIFMPNPSRVYSYGTGGGNITLISKSAIIQEEASGFDSYVESGVLGSAQGGDVTLIAPFISLSRYVQSSIYGGDGDGGKLLITANSLVGKGAVILNYNGGGDGDLGEVIVNANSIYLDDSILGSLTESSSGGNASDVKVTTNTFVGINGGQVLSSTGGVADGGNVEVTADSITLIGTKPDSDIFSGFSSTVRPGAEGNGGTIKVQIRTLSMQDGGQIRTSIGGIGNGGRVEVTAAESIVMDGVALFIDPDNPDPVIIPSGILSEIRPDAEGQGGVIEVKTGQLSVSNGAFISASTSGIGNAGDIFVTATESASFDGNPGEPFFPSGAYVGVLEGSDGNGGTLTITTSSLSVTNGAQLEALTESSGNAGSIFVNANSIFLSGADTGLFSNATETSTGDGGLIQVEGNTLTLANGAQISTDTAGSGDAGSTIINVDKIITLSGTNTGIFASTAPGSTGEGGSIFIDPDVVLIKDGAAIVVDSQGSGTGGSISLRAGQLILDNQGRISADTASTNGGGITLDLDDYLLLRRGSRISTNAGNASAGGDGGDITINTPFIVAVPQENSDITANAFLGRGGNVNVTVTGIFGIDFEPALTPESDITASSEFGISGTVTINSPEIDTTSSISNLPIEVTDASNQVVAGCAAAEGNSFTITGRGGLPSDPTAPIRGQTVISDVRDFTATNTSNQSRNSFPNSSRQVKARSQIVEANSWIINEQGQVELVATKPQETTAINNPNCINLKN